MIVKSKPTMTVSVPKAAELVGVSRSKMYELIRIEDFPLCRWGGTLRVPVDKLEVWVNEQAEKGWRA